MGVHSSHLNPHSSFSIQDWQQIPLSPYTDIKDPSYGSNFKVYSNKLNPNSQVEQYDLFFNSYEEFLEYRQVIYWRTGARFLVQAKHINEPKKHQICSTFEHSSVFLERIPIRLVEIQDISVQEGLCILYSALQGFDKLYDKYGFFQIEPQMIGFTKEGFVRVWLNKNLSRHYPENIYIQYKYRTYDYFIETLIRMIEHLIDFEGRLTITQYLQRHHQEEPYNKLSSSLQNYAKQYQIIVPRFLTSIRNICQGSRNKRSTTERQEIQKEKNRTPKASNKKKKNILEVNNQTVRVSVCGSHRPSYPPLEQLQLNKKSISQAPATDRYMSVSSRTPAVRFHYRNITLPDSPKTTLKESPSHFQHSSTTLTSTKRMNSSDTLYCFYKKAKRFQSKLQKWEIDPEIAADLAKLNPIKQ